MIFHTGALFFANGGLGNGIILAPLLAALERAMPDLEYFSPPNAMFSAGWVRSSLGLRGPRQELPVVWRRFLPQDRDAVIDFCRNQGVTLIINLRKEAAERDGNYFAFKQMASQRGIECWDLHELVGKDLRLPIGSQAAEVMRRHGIPVGDADPTWLAHLYAPRPRVTGLCVGASVEVKRWRADRWSALIDLLGTRVDLVEVCAGPDECEQGIARQLAERHAETVRLKLMASTDELCGWIASLDRLVSNDTLAVHLAAALGCPTVALYLATESRIWSPLAGRTFMPVQSRVGRFCGLMKIDGTCSRFYKACPAPCREAVRPADVLTAIDSLAALSNPDSKRR